MEDFEGISIYRKLETANWRPGTQKLGNHFSVHFCLVKTPSTAIWGQQIMKITRTQFFQVHYCPGGTKRQNSSSNASFLGSKTGIRTDTKSSYGSKCTFDKTDLDHFPARVFLYFPRKMGFRVSGTKKKNR